MWLLVKNKRIHIILATTLSGILVWASVNLSSQYQTTITAPVVVESLPRGKAVRTPLPKSVQLRFSGEGWKLAALLLGPEQRCVLDLNSVTSYQKAITLTDVSERLTFPSGVLPLGMKPESLYVALDWNAQKQVPVVFDGSLSYREGYGQVGTSTILPESVTIAGARTVLQTIESWPTMRRTLENVRSRIDIMIPLSDTIPYWVTVTPGVVRVTLDVQPFAEKLVASIPVEAHSVPRNCEVILIPQKIDLVVRGGIDQLSNLKLTDFHASVDYATILTDSSGLMDPQITAPTGIQIVSRKPDRLQYVVRKQQQ